MSPSTDIWLSLNIVGVASAGDVAGPERAPRVAAAVVGPGARLPHRLRRLAPEVPLPPTCVVAE